MSAVTQVVNALTLLVQEHGAPNSFGTQEVLWRCKGLTAAQAHAASRGVSLYARPAPGKLAVFTYAAGVWRCGTLQDDTTIAPTHQPVPVDASPRGLAQRIREAAGKVNGRRLVLPGITADDIYTLADAFLACEPATDPSP